MENNIENKQKYFAAHWGQEILFVDKYTGIRPVDGFFIYDALDGDGSYLELTPLSKISDEDAIEVGKLFALANGFPNDNNFTKNDVIEMLNDCPIIPYQCIDYLRSKRYAFDYMGLSVEKQIEYGWIKLKNN